MHHRRTPSNTSTLGSTLGTSSGPSSPPSTTGPYYSNQLLTVQSQPKLSNSTNTFVHKLYNMVLDDQYQHLIAWSYTGASFIVCNIMDFSRDVLPKHFKHNNFSSFVRQLNMYGFHKVNKSPRGHRTLAENQIWEFSHQKFLRGRPELLDDIKRKAMEATDNQQRQVNGDIQAHMNLIQSSQSDMMHQLTGLYENFNHVVKELQETRRKQEAQDHLLRNMMQYICHQNNGQLPPELDMGSYPIANMNTTTSTKNEKEVPSIYITTHHNNNNNNNNNHTTSSSSASSVSSSTMENNNGMLNIHDAPVTPTSIGSRSPHTLTSYLPPSPSASTMISEDDLDPNRNYHQHYHHRRHLSASAAIPQHQHHHQHLSTSTVHPHLDHHTLQPTLPSHPNGAFDFINPHDPLTH